MSRYPVQYPDYKACFLGLKMKSDKAFINKTNNSTHVIHGYRGEIATVPSLVNQDTDLDSLNLNWAEKDLPEKERTKHVHRLHPYLGKYIPQLVEVFLRKYFVPGQRIYDPFTGSGTTLVQANELGIHSVGVDISEFNVLLTKVKTGVYDIEKLKKEVKNIISRLFEQTRNTNSSLFSQKIKYRKTNNNYINLWFHKNTIHDLLTFKELIPEYEYQDVLKIILSRSARSARLTTHFDLDFPKKPQTGPYYCRKHDRTCQPVDEAYKFLYRYGFDTVERIKQFSKIRTNAEVQVIHGDSRSVNIGEINGLITSPPYVGLINYHEQHRYSYELLDLEQRNEEEIGAAFKGQGKSAKIEYIDKISEVLLNAKNQMVKNGIVVIVANDKWNLYDDIRQNTGLYEEAKVIRHVNRRTGRRTTPYFETVFIWKKK